MLAVVSSFSCTLTGILAARLTDRARGHMKTSITTLLFLATGLFTLLSLVSLKVKVQRADFTAVKIFSR